MNNQLTITSSGSKEGESENNNEKEGINSNSSSSSTSIEEEEEEEEENLEEFFKRYKLNNSKNLSGILNQMGVGVGHLLHCREKDIEDICKEGNIGVINRIELLKLLHKIPESRVYKDYNKPKLSSQMIVLKPEEHEKMNQMYNEYKRVSEDISKTQEQIINIDEQSKVYKENIIQIFNQLKEHIDSHQEKLLNEMEGIKNNKKNILIKHVEELQHYGQQIKQWNDSFSECLNESNINININEKQPKISNLLKNTVPIKSYDSVDSLVIKDFLQIQSNIPYFCKTLEETMTVEDNCIKIKLNKVIVDPTKDELCFEWCNQNFSNDHKNAVFEFETKNTEKAQEEEKKNNENNSKEDEITTVNAWKRIKEISMHVKNGSNSCNFVMDLLDDIQCAFRMRARLVNSSGSVKYSGYSNVVKPAIKPILYSEPCQLSLKVAKCRKHYLNYVPENLLNSDNDNLFGSDNDNDNLYASALNGGFYGNEPDWIVFECSDDTICHHLTEVHIRTRGDNMAPKLMMLEYSEKIDPDKWHTVNPNPITTQYVNNMQIFELQTPDAKNWNENLIKFIKVSFLQNWGAVDLLSCRYVAQELKLFGVIART